VLTVSYSSHERYQHIIYRLDSIIYKTDHALPTAGGNQQIFEFACGGVLGLGKRGMATLGYNDATILAALAISN